MSDPVSVAVNVVVGGKVVATQAIDTIDPAKSIKLMLGHMIDHFAWAAQTPDVPKKTELN